MEVVDKDDGRVGLIPFKRVLDGSLCLRGVVSRAVLTAVPERRGMRVGGGVLGSGVVSEAETSHEY